MSDLDDLANAARSKAASPPRGPTPPSIPYAPPAVPFTHQQGRPFRDAFMANAGAGLARLLILGAILAFVLVAFLVCAGIAFVNRDQPTPKRPPLPWTSILDM